ncbi:hypothetical protein MJO28_006550 [Puccinia striiformis f. sp. tritici]|uniref:Uncharacterized protein n=1 Tax=Puccinia striiformis f. sp. tritici TaxID=168172 RepID=A0ACC0EHC9_9BASI|nr:hypothetical protein MJO28_006550 [Puccinia striiformis f. sp. tritici]
MVEPYHARKFPKDSKRSLETTDQLIARQRVYVSKGFLDLIDKHGSYNSKWSKSLSSERAEPIDRSNWRAAFDGLENDILPLLYQQIESLSQLLEISELHIDTSRKLESISDAQVELGHSLQQLISLLSLFVRGHWDRQFEPMTITGKISKNRLQLRRLDYKARVTKHTVLVKESIERMYDWLTANEFQLIQDDWELTITRIDKILTRLTKLVNPPEIDLDDDKKGKVEDDSDYDSEDEWRSEAESLSEPAIELARSAIPIIKLSRLFFRKLLRVSRNDDFQMESSFTEMSSIQLNGLAYSCHNIRDSNRTLYEILDEAETSDERDTIRDLGEELEINIRVFDSTIQLLVAHVIPLMPTLPQHPQHSYQSNHPLKTWLLTWNDMFLSATKKCEQAGLVFQLSD